MIEIYKRSPGIYQPSKYWDHLIEKNLNQLSKNGYENIKQTVNLNYFNFMVSNEDSDQFYWLLDNVNHSYSREYIFSLSNTEKYEIFVKLLWEFASTLDTENILNTIEEPLEGNPFKIYNNNNKLISQDLANSVIEYYSMMEAPDLKNNQNLTVAEIGAGYGRTAYVFLKKIKNVKYFVVDIPPALHIAQKYLTDVFPEKKIFEFKEFTNVDELFDYDIIFLMPHQLEFLPLKTIDLFITISTLHEMNLDKINFYLFLMNRLTSGYFYSKQWYSTVIPFDNIPITYKDYKVPGENIFFRTARPQIRFFEGLYKQ